MSYGHNSSSLSFVHKDEKKRQDIKDECKSMIYWLSVEKKIACVIKFQQEKCMMHVSVNEK